MSIASIVIASLLLGEPARVAAQEQAETDHAALREGLRHELAGRAEAARAAYRDAAVNAATELAALMDASGDSTAAENLLRETGALLPGERRLDWARARLYLRRNEVAAAANLLQPDGPADADELTYLRAAVRLYEHQPEAALALLAPALAGDHHDLLALAAGLAHLVKGDLAAANLHLERYLQTDAHGRLERRVRIAQAYEETGYPDEAIAHYEAASSQDPEAGAFSLAVVLLRRRLPGDLERAIAEMTTYLARNRDDVPALRILAQAHWSLGSPASAADTFARIAELEPDVARNHLDLGLSAFEAGRLEPAVRALGRFLERVDSGNAAVRRRTHYVLSRALRQAGDMAGAARHREEAARLAEGAEQADREATLSAAGPRPDHHSLRRVLFPPAAGSHRERAALKRTLAKAYLQLGLLARDDETQAGPLLAEAGRHDASLADHYERMGMAFLADHLTRAIEALETSAALDPTRATVCSALANALLKATRLADAERVRRRCGASNPF